jgi:Pentatricopeptide repeat domain
LFYYFLGTATLACVIVSLSAFALSSAVANTMLLKLLGAMVLFRAASSFCLSFCAKQQVLVAARKLVMASSASDDPAPDKRSDGRQPLKRSSSSNNAYRFSSTAIQKSKALTARIGELGRQGRWQDVLRALEAAENNGQKLYVNNFSAAIAALTRSKQPARALQLLPRMQRQGVRFNVVTYNNFIDACSKTGSGRQLWSY